MSQRSISSKCLSEGSDREELLAQHPIYQRPSKILTPAIKTMFLDAYEALKLKRPGSSFMADFRIGKSTALAMLRDELPKKLPKMAFLLIAAKQHSPVSERTIWGDLCEGAGLGLSGSAQERQARFRNSIVAACLEKGGTEFCLLLDEAQNWSKFEFTWLRDLSNGLLATHSITFLTVLIGDLRLGELSTTFRTSRKDLWGRFLIRPRRFYGIRSKSELEFFLRQHDQPASCEYPLGSGISYSEFLLPKAYSAGWRLESESEKFWDSLQRAATKVHKKPEEVGMQWIGEGVVQFLTSKLAEDSIAFASGEDDWDEAVNLASYEDSII